MHLNDLLTKACNDERLSADEVVYLLSLPPVSSECYQLLAVSRQLSDQVCMGQAEVHAQFAVNLAPCPKNCMFCSFAAKNGIFKAASKVSPDAAVASCPDL